MKNLFLSFIFCAIFVQIGQSQDISSYFGDIAKGDISAISSKFSNDMEVCVYDTQDFMSKPEAIKAINKFLGDVKPFAGSELHKGSSKSKNSQYRVGQIKTAKGNYRLFIYMEGEADNFKIVGVLFNPE